MSSKADLAAAEAEAAAARDRLTRTMVDIQSRLNPRALVREAVEEAREVGSELLHAGMAHARRHPGPLIAIGTTLAALLARDWFSKRSGSSANASPPDADPPPPARPNPNMIKAEAKRPPRRKR